MRIYLRSIILSILDDGVDYILTVQSGYNVLGGEITAHAVDWREQLDLSTPHAAIQTGDPQYYNLYGPNQWPEESLLPGFRSTLEDYISEMSILSVKFTSLIAEALQLSANAFDRFFEENQQHKLKIVRYPDLDELGVPLPKSAAEAEAQSQGVGPHKDSMLTSYLLQASEHRGLQAQNMSGEWVDCPPKPGTLVVALGQGLEAVTHGVCQSTTHRVLSPGRGLGSRYSLPFFQGVSYNGDFSYIDVPENILEEKRAFLAEAGGRKDDVEFTFFKGGRFANFGEATLYNRAKSHMDVAERWYPELYREIKDDHRVGRAVNGNLPAVKEQTGSNTPSVGGILKAH